MITGKALAQMLEVVNDENAELEVRLNTLDEAIEAVSEINHVLIKTGLFYSILFDRERGYYLFMNDVMKQKGNE